MPRRSSDYRSPKDWIVEGTWPNGTFAADTPQPVAHAAAIAIALAAAIHGRSKSDIATRAGIERSTLYDILSGNSWADTVTLAKLEAELNVTLWPDTPAPPLRRQ